MILISFLFCLATVFPSNGTNNPVSYSQLIQEERSVPLLASQKPLEPGSLSPYAALALIPHTLLEYQYASGSMLGSLNFLKEQGIELYSQLIQEERSVPLLASQKPLEPGSLSPYAALARIPHTLLEYQYASGSMLGSLDFFKEYGIEPSITYTSDSAGNPVGGKYPGGFTYCDNIAFSLLLKTEKLIGWKDGYFVISGLQRDGDSLTKENIKNIFPVQQVYGGNINTQTFHFYQLYFEQKMLDDRANFKIGRFVAADDFDSSPLYWLYMNRAIDGRPFSLSLDAGFSCPPNAVWATRAKFKLPESTILRAGAYQVTKNSVNGLNWNFYPNDGLMLLAQYEWDPEFFKPICCSSNDAAFLTSTQKNRSARQVPGGTPVPKGFVGHYWVGSYYSTFEYQQFNSTSRMPNAYGFYWHGDQTVYRPNCMSNEGLALWTALTLSPQKNIALMPFAANGGLVYTGLIPGRRNDFTMLGCAYGDISTTYASLQQKKNHVDPTYELIYEAGYRINTTKYTYIQPDLQWIINPGGTGKIPNALVLGFQIGIIL